MSITVEAPVPHHIQSSFIEWDTVRGRGDFDAGYVNEFSLCMNENGEIDEEKRKQFGENSFVRIHKTSSLSHKRSRQNILNKKSTASDGQVLKKGKKTRTVKLSTQKQLKTSSTKPEKVITDSQNSE